MFFLLIRTFAVIILANLLACNFAKATVFPLQLRHHKLENSHSNIKEIFQETKMITARLPSAMCSSLMSSAGAFFQTASVLIPIGLILKLGIARSNPRQWLIDGSKMGIEWGSFSALYTVSSTINFTFYY